jgi:hypothetical protein
VRILSPLDFRDGAAVSGRWTVVGHSPLQVTDPEKVAAFLGKAFPYLPDNVVGSVEKKAHGILTLPLSLGRMALDALVGADRREFERLIFGSRIVLEDAFSNLVVNEGLDHLLDVTLSGGTQDTTWFLGLTGGTPAPAAADTLTSHAGWTEVTFYDEVTRVAWVDGGVSSQSVDNSGSPATFTINADQVTIGGAFLAGVDNTGVTGILYAVGAFTGGNKVLGNQDTLDVTATFTQAAA